MIRQTIPTKAPVEAETSAITNKSCFLKNFILNYNIEPLGAYIRPAAELLLLASDILCRGTRCEQLVLPYDQRMILHSLESESSSPSEQLLLRC